MGEALKQHMSSRSAAAQKAWETRRSGAGPQKKEGTGREPGGEKTSPPKVLWGKVKDDSPKQPTRSKEAAPKQADFRSQIEKLGGDPKQADRYLRGWTESTGNKFALRLRGAALRVMAPASGPQLAQMDAQRLGHGNSAEVSRVFQHMTEGDRATNTAKAIIDHSQSAYKEETVTLWRGVRSDQQITPEHNTLKTDSLTCFTEDEDVAHSFAKRGTGKHGAVYKVQVPRSSIVATHRAIPHLHKSGEKEVIVFTGGSVRGEVTHTY